MSEDSFELGGFLPQAELLGAKSSPEPSHHFPKESLAISYAKVIGKTSKYWVQFSDDSLQIHGRIAPCYLLDFVLECLELFGLYGYTAREDCDTEKFDAFATVSNMRFAFVHSELEVFLENFAGSLQGIFCALS